MPSSPESSPQASQAADQVTAVLLQVRAGDANASSRLLPLVYEHLRALARSKLVNLPPGNTLQPTALVHEAYLRIMGDQDERSWDHRGHFFGAAARAMRDILVDQARHKSSMKAGGGRRRTPLDDEAALPPLLDDPADLAGGAGDGERMLALDAAIRRFEAQDPRKAEAVMLKYFAGLEHDTIAGILGISVPTLDRDLRFARAWLARDLKAADIES